MKNYQAYFALIFCCFLLPFTSFAQKSKKSNSSPDSSLNKSQWSVGLIAGGKTIKSLFVYDYGISVSKSLSLGHRLRLEGNYRTSGPMFEQNWGRYAMNMKTQIGSPMGGISYEWFPFVSNLSYIHNRYFKYANFWQSIKLKAGFWYIQDPVYHFDASLVDPVTWGSITFNPEEIGSVTTTISTQQVQPYLGIGYDRFYTGKKTTISLEGGVLYQGKPQVGMTATNMLELTATQAPILQNNLGDYQIIPFVQLVLQIRL
jgi:hypothetical protein